MASSDIPSVWLSAGREKSVLRRHPWIFAGSISRVEGEPINGGTVRVTSSKGGFLAWGAFSIRSQIRVRIWSWDETQVINEAFLRARLQQAIARRQAVLRTGSTNAVRLVHGESDGLPGLVVDRYKDTLVAQFLSSGPEFWKSALADLIIQLGEGSSLYERSDVDVRKLEGLSGSVGCLRGGEPPERVMIEEYGLSFKVDVRRGHKTGFYLDQRENRRKLYNTANGCRVLDCFSYSGGFSINALAGGAKQVLAVDASAEALALARENLTLNGLANEQLECLQGDVFQILRQFRDQNRDFDLIVLDPPKFAPTAAQAERAARGYKDINLLAFKLLRPGGTLFTFSCSGGIDESLFQKIVAGAALDAGVDVQIVDHMHQAPDHPVSLSFPEGTYLKGLVLLRI